MAVLPDLADPVSTAVLPHVVRSNNAAVTASWRSNRLTVTYALYKSEQVTISLSAVNGKKVADLFSGQKNAGSHVNTWARSDAFLRSLAPNTYLVVVTTGSRSLARRIVLTR